MSKMEVAGKSESLIVIHNAVIVTMNPQLDVFRHGGIAVEGDTIKAIGQSDDILTQFSHFPHSQFIDLHGQFLLPGLINTHVHTSQQLGRGIADDVDLVTWLHHRIWPYESNMTPHDSYISTLLCGIELIHSGVTCFAEAGGQHVPEMARAVQLLGLRACLTESIMDTGKGLPASWAIRTTDHCIQSQKELYNKYNNTADGRIRIWFGIRQIMNSTDRLLLETRDAAKEFKTGIHMHVAEIDYENHVVKDTRKVDYGTVTYLEKMKLLQSNLLAAHTVWVNEKEGPIAKPNMSTVTKIVVKKTEVKGKSAVPILVIKPVDLEEYEQFVIPYLIQMLSEAGTKVSHCPASAMRMLGFAPIKEMLDSKICVSLGTDGAPSNNRMSIVDEMYLASLINKGREVYSKGTTDPTALPADIVLQMATINGAKSILWDNEIGSLEVGKKADMIVVNPFSWTMVPFHDCISSLVYSMRSENVISVMCNGRWIMKDHKILNVDEEGVISMARTASTELLKRASIHIPSRMNFV